MKRSLAVLLASGAVVATGSASAAIVPVLYFDFEGESGAGIAANSTASLAVTTQTGAKDQFQSGLVADDVAGFGGTDPFTIVATFQLDSGTALQNNTIFGYSPTNGGVAGGDIRIYAKNNGDIRIEASAGAGSNFTPTGINILDDGVHTLALVAAGGENFNDLDVYIDGVLFTNPLSAGNNAQMNLAGSSLAGNVIEVGSDRTQGRDFLGLIDDVAIYGQALTTAELDDIRANGVVPEPGSIALLTLGGLLAARRRRG